MSGVCVCVCVCGHPSLPSLPGSPGMQDAVVAGQVSAASVVRYTAVKQMRATRNLTVRGSIFSCNLRCILSGSSIKMIPVISSLWSGFY